MTQPSTDVYVVVCTDLHHGVGPFASLEQATAAARRMTDSASECVYLPVPFQFLGVLLNESEYGQLKGKPDSKHTGQYL